MDTTKPSTTSAGFNPGVQWNWANRTPIRTLIAFLLLASLWAGAKLFFDADSMSQVIRDESILTDAQQITKPIDTLDKAIKYAFGQAPIKEAFISRRSAIKKVHSVIPYWVVDAKLPGFEKNKVWDLTITSEEVRPKFWCKIRIGEDGVIDNNSIICAHELK